MFEHVVVGVRGEHSGRDASALAEKLVSPHGTLTLLHVDLVASKPAPDSGAARDADKRRHALERLAALAAEVPHGAELACTEARSVRRGLHEFVRCHNADLLVIGTTHFDAAARDLSTDDTREVLEDAPCATAVVPAGYRELRPAIQTIGVAYDGSAESEQALARARALAAERHAELSMFEVVGGAALHVRDAWDVRGTEIDEQVLRARQRIPALGELEADASSGDTVEELSRYGATVDLLVIGSHKYRPIDRLLGPTTAQQLADATYSPPLVLAPDGMR